MHIITHRDCVQLLLRSAPFIFPGCIQAQTFVTGYWPHQPTFLHSPHQRWQPMHLCFTHHVVITSHPSANEHMRCYTTIFESVLVSIQLNHSMLVPMPSGSATPCWFLHHPAQSPRVGSYTIRLSRPCRFLWHQAQSPRVGSYAIQLHHPVLVPTPSGSVTPCRFLCHPAQSPLVGSYAIRLSHPVLVPMPSGSAPPPLVGSYAIRLNHPVLVPTPSGSVTPCRFLCHPAQ